MRLIRNIFNVAIAVVANKFCTPMQNYTYSNAPLRFFKNIEMREITIPINAIVLAA